VSDLARAIDNPPAPVMPGASISRWLRRPVPAAFVVSRAVALAALLIGGSADQGRLSTIGLTSWDGQWYLNIVRSGYGPPPVARAWTRWPFFPLLPGIVRAFELTGVPPRWGLVGVANGAFAIALAGVWRLAGQRCSRRVAVIAVWTVAAAPFASVLSMGYPSSLFLAASTWAFVLLNERRYLAAGATAAVATMARPNGVVVLIGLAVALTWRAAHATDRRTRRRTAQLVALVCGPGLVALAAWCLELWRWTGSPLVFWSAKQGWNELTMVGLTHSWPPDAIPHLVVAAVAIALILVASDRLEPAWVAFAAAYLLPSFGFGIVGLGRYSGECFPAALACGIALERVRPVVLRAVVGGSAVAMAVFAVAISTHALLP
jgi:hypothetical protein